MANSKISALTAITSLATDDEFVVVDTDAATTKKITRANLVTDILGASTAVLAASTLTDNAIIRGDGGTRGSQTSGITIDDSDNITGATSLTIDGATGNTLVVNTSDLVVDSDNGRVGIGNTTPDTDLSIAGNASLSWVFNGATEGGISVGAGYLDGRVYVEGSQSAGFFMYDSGGVADERTLGWQINGGTSKFRSFNDSGTSNFTFFELNHNSDQILISPTISGTETIPVLAFGDGDTGFYESLDDILRVSIAGTNKIYIDGAEFRAALNDGPSMRFEAATATNPTFAFQADDDTGLGKAAADQLSLIAGGVEGIRITESGAAITAIDFSGPLNMSSNSITMTGSLASTGSRVTKGWFTDIESTNMPTVGGTAILSSLTAPQFTTIELGHATDTTLARVSAGVVSIEGVNIVTESATQTLTNKTLGATTLSGALTGGDQNITGLGSASFTQELDNGSKTTSFSIDFATDQKQKVTLTANTMTLTLDTTSVGVGNYLLKIVNGGLATLTWASETGSIFFPGGTDPSLTSSGTDIVSLYFDGTNWYGVGTLNFS